jgi:hypothetical protein
VKQEVAVDRDLVGGKWPGFGGDLSLGGLSKDSSVALNGTIAAEYSEVPNIRCI